MKPAVALEVNSPVRCEASGRERWKKIPVSWFGNWVDGMLSIKIGTPGGGAGQGEEGREFTPGAPGFEVPREVEVEAELPIRHRGTLALESGRQGQARDTDSGSPTDQS